MTQVLVLGAAAGVAVLLAQAFRPTTLHEAATRNHLSGLKELLRQGHDPARKNANGDTPLHIAARHESLNIITELVRYNSSLIHITNRSQRTPLMEAVVAKALPSVRILIQYTNRKSEIEKAISLSDHTGVVRVLLNALPDRGTAMLCSAARAGKLDKLDKLVRNGVSLYSKDRKGMTPLHHAATTGQVKCISAMMNCGTHINARNREGNTALHLAVQSNHLRAAEALVYAGANREVVNNWNQTPSEIARSTAMYNVVKPPACSIM